MFNLISGLIHIFSLFRKTFKLYRQLNFTNKDQFPTVSGLFVYKRSKMLSVITPFSLFCFIKALIVKTFIF